MNSDETAEIAKVKKYKTFTKYAKNFIILKYTCIKYHNHTYCINVKGISLFFLICHNM